MSLQMRVKLLNAIKIVFYGIVFWIWMTSIYQAFQCPEMTDTQRFLSIPNSFILKFKYCNE